MVSPISFTSTYNVNGKQNSFEKFQKFQFLAQNEEAEHNARMDLNITPCEAPIWLNEGTIGDNYKPKEILSDETRDNGYLIGCTLVAPDERDEFIETYCIQNGITYKKIGTDDTMLAEQIEKRVLKPYSESARLTKIKAEEFEKLIKDQTGNTDWCRSEYDNRRMNDVDLTFRLGEKFPTTRIAMFSNCGLTADLLTQLKEQGPESLKKDQLHIVFGHIPYTLDYVMYFGMKELGMKNIPVYMDEITYQISNQLGLISE